MPNLLIYQDLSAAYCRSKPEADVDDVRKRLQTTLDALPTAFEAKRLERLRAAPLDPNKLREFGEAVEARVLQEGPEIAPFAGLSVDVQADLDGEPSRLSISGFDRGLFVTPSRSPMSLSDIVDHCALTLRQALGQRIRASIRPPAEDDHSRPYVRLP